MFNRANNEIYICGFSDQLVNISDSCYLVFFPRMSLGNETMYGIALTAYECFVFTLQTSFEYLRVCVKYT